MKKGVIVCVAIICMSIIAVALKVSSSQQLIQTSVEALSDVESGAVRIPCKVSTEKCIYNVKLADGTLVQMTSDGLINDPPLN